MQRVSSLLAIYSVVNFKTNRNSWKTLSQPPALLS